MHPPPDVFGSLLEALEKEGGAVLATLLTAEGSVPATAPSRMVVTRGGSLLSGTVGGGALEAMVIQEAAGTKNRSRLLSIELNEGDLGVLCGGSAEILLEPLNPSDAPFFRKLWERQREGSDSLLLRIIEGGGEAIQRAFLGEISQIQEVPGLSLSHLREAAQRALAEEHSVEAPGSHGRRFVLEPVQGLPRLLIFGGGHIGRSLAPLARAAGFRVVVADERPEYASRQRFPDAAECFVLDYAHTRRILDPGPADYVVIVTRGHRGDATVLGEVLPCRCLYVGMIGSKNKVLATFHNLLAAGADRRELERVHAPVGLDIGAVTVEEIAVSIAAELVAVRRKKEPPGGHLSAALVDAVFNLSQARG